MRFKCATTQIFATADVAIAQQANTGKIFTIKVETWDVTGVTYTAEKLLINGTMTEVNMRAFSCGNRKIETGGFVSI
jgi:hypothetical protein